MIMSISGGIDSSSLSSTNRMMISAPRSYYEEYLRKRDTGRLIANPPNLLTDRNSYVNFLEIQLERVTAACMSVQSYDDRFNDIQNLILTIEQRFLSTTKLIALAQQCSEEIRSEAMQKIDSNYQDFKAYRIDSNKLIESQGKQINYLSNIIDKLLTLESKIKGMSDRVDEYEQHYHRLEYQLKEDSSKIHSQFDKVDMNHQEILQLIDSNRANISRMNFNLEDNHSRVSAYMRAVEQRFDESISRTKKEIEDKLLSCEAKIINNNEYSKQLMEKYEVDVIAMIKKHYTSMNYEIEESNKRHSDEIEQLNEQITIHNNQKLQQLESTMNKNINKLQGCIDEQNYTILNLENEFITQLEVVTATTNDTSHDLNNIHHRYDNRLNTLEARIDILTDSNQQLTKTLLSQTNAYNNLIFHSRYHDTVTTTNDDNNDAVSIMLPNTTTTNSSMANSINNTSNSVGVNKSNNNNSNNNRSSNRSISINNSKYDDGDDDGSSNFGNSSYVLNSNRRSSKIIIDNNNNNNNNSFPNNYMRNNNSRYDNNINSQKDRYDNDINNNNNVDDGDDNYGYDDDDRNLSRNSALGGTRSKSMLSHSMDDSIIRNTLSNSSRVINDRKSSKNLSKNNYNNDNNKNSIRSDMNNRSSCNSGKNMPTLSRSSMRSKSILSRSMNDDVILNNNISGRKVMHDKISSRSSSGSNSKINNNRSYSRSVNNNDDDEGDEHGNGDYDEKRPCSTKLGNRANIESSRNTHSIIKHDDDNNNDDDDSSSDIRRRSSSSSSIRTSDTTTNTTTMIKDILNSNERSSSRKSDHAAAAAVSTAKRPSVDTYRVSTTNYGDTPTTSPPPPHHHHAYRENIIVISASSSNDDTSRGIDDTIDYAIATTISSSSRRVDDTRSTNSHSRGSHSDHRYSRGTDREVDNSRRSSCDNNRPPPSIGAGDLISNTRNSSHVNNTKSTTTTTTTTKPTSRSTTAATVTATIATGTGSKVRWLSDSNDDNNEHRMNNNRDYHNDDGDATRNKDDDDNDNRNAYLSRLVNSNRSSWYDDDDDDGRSPRVDTGDRRSHSFDDDKRSTTVLDDDGDDDDDSGDGGKQLIDVPSDCIDADRDDELPLSLSDTVEKKSYDDVYNDTNNHNKDHDNRITKNCSREHDGSIGGRTRATTDNRNDGDVVVGGRDDDDDTDSIRMTELIDRYISNSSQSHSEKQKKMINRSGNDYDDDDNNGGNGNGSRVSHRRSIHSRDSSRHQDDDGDNDDDDDDDDNGYDIMNKSNTSIHEKSNSINGDGSGCDNNRYRNHNMMVKMRKKKISNRTEHVRDMFAKYLHETHHDPRHISPSLQRLQSYLDNNNHPNHDNINHHDHHHHHHNSRHRSYSRGTGGAEHEKPPWKPSSNTSKHILKISTTNAVDHDRSLSNHHQYHHHQQHTRDDDLRGGGVNGLSVIGNRLSKTVSRNDIDRLIQANRQVSVQSLKGDGIDDCGNSINSSKSTTTTTTNTTNTTSRMSTKTVDT